MAQLSHIPLQYFQVTGQIASAATQAADDGQLVAKVASLAVALGIGVIIAGNHDCWEERGDDIHISTLAAIYAGLNAAARLVPGIHAIGRRILADHQ